MAGILKMTGSMSILGVITATNMAADQTHSQMEPFVPHLKALFATIRLGRDSFRYLPQMLTVHYFALSPASEGSVSSGS